jgi:hypothetical protein
MIYPDIFFRLLPYGGLLLLVISWKDVWNSCVVPDTDLHRNLSQPRIPILNFLKRFRP